MNVNEIYWLVVSNMNFIFHIWDVIPNPFTKSIIIQDGQIAPPTSMGGKGDGTQSVFFLDSDEWVDA